MTLRLLVNQIRKDIDKTFSDKVKNDLITMNNTSLSHEKSKFTMLKLYISIVLRYTAFRIYITA